MKLLVMVLALMPTQVLAFEQVTSRSEFLQRISGKAITYALFGVSLRVSEAGTISGRAQGKDVTGNWSWQGAYFCRDMAWGKEVIEYDCQRVDATASRIRFTSERGAGRAATFGLR